MDINPGWTLDTGWAYGVPTGANQDGKGNVDPTSGQNGANVIGYKLDGDYEASIPSTRYAKTAAINCVGYQNVRLGFYRWLGVEKSSYDHVSIEASNNGTTWTSIWTNPDASIYDAGWTYYEYDISAVADGKSTVYIRWGMGSTDSSYNFSGWNLDEVKVDGNPAISNKAVITPGGGSTDVVEGGSTDSYTVTLSSAPTANVTINIAPDPQVAVSPASLTFTTANWSTPQTVTVTAVDDSLYELAHTGSINHSATSADANYDGISIDGLLVIITDNDNSFTVTFNKQGGTGGNASVLATYGSAMPAGTAPTRTGYSFGGYYTAAGGLGIQYYDAAMASARNWDITASTTLYAKWTTGTNISSAAKHFIRGEAETTQQPGYYITPVSGTVGTSGSSPNRDDRNTVFGFTLPTLPEGATLESATFNFEITSARDSTGAGNLPELHAYLLNAVDPTNSGTGFFYHGASDPSANAKRIGTTSVTISGTAQVNYPAGQEVRAFTLSGESLALLKSYYSGNTPTRSTAYFRFNMSVDPAVNSLRRYNVNTADASSSLQLVYVAPTNRVPVWVANPLTQSNATERIAYSGSLADSATDIDNDPLIFAKVSGPAWLSVAANGTLSGTPGTSDIGTNHFTVTVSDGNASTSNDVVIIVLRAGFTTIGAVPYVWLASWTNDFENAVTNDWDRDGFTTLQEYWSGTDPMDSNSFFRIDSIINNGTNLVLKWQHASITLTNPIPPISIETTSNLLSGGWTYAGQVQPTNGTNTWTTTNMVNCFYRLCATNMPPNP
jgi:hypothetical protein